MESDGAWLELTIATAVTATSGTSRAGLSSAFGAIRAAPSTPIRRGVMVGDYMRLTTAVLRSPFQHPRVATGHGARDLRTSNMCSRSALIGNIDARGVGRTSATPQWTVGSVGGSQRPTRMFPECTTGT